MVASSLSHKSRHLFGKTILLLLMSSTLGGCNIHSSPNSYPAPVSAPEIRKVDRAQVFEQKVRTERIQPLPSIQTTKDTFGNTLSQTTTCSPSNSVSCQDMRENILSDDIKSLSERGAILPEQKISQLSTTPLLPEVIIELNAGGFDRALVSLETGQTLIVKNRSTTPRWPYSPSFPSFDSGRPISPNQSYAFTFTRPGIYPLADKLIDGIGSTVYVR